MVCSFELKNLSKIWIRWWIRSGFRIATIGFRNRDRRNACIGCRRGEWILSFDHLRIARFLENTRGLSEWRWSSRRTYALFRTVRTGTPEFHFHDWELCFVMNDGREMELFKETVTNQQRERERTREISLPISVIFFSFLRLTNEWTRKRGKREIALFVFSVTLDHRQ